MSEDWKMVASTADFDERGLQVVENGGREILLCRQGEEVFAIENLCSHAEEKLFHGKLKGGRIFCPLHGASFDIRTGEALARPASTPVDTFEVLVRDYDILMRTDQA